MKKAGGRRQKAGGRRQEVVLMKQVSPSYSCTLTPLHPLSKHKQTP